MSILIIATGGTIAGTSKKSGKSGYDSGVLTCNQLLEDSFHIISKDRIRTEQFCNIGSQDMSFPLLLKLAYHVNDLLEDTEIDGVVITHGTDTMEESAFFLSLVTHSKKPVVFTGAMRPSDDSQPDGPGNLSDAVSVAYSSLAHNRGVLLVMNGAIHQAHRVMKSHTLSIDTFVNGCENYLYGNVENGSVKFNFPVLNRTLPLFDVSHRFISFPRVDIFYGCTEMNPDLISASIKYGSKGIILAGVGNGNLNQSVLDTCKDLVNRGCVVVRASRVPFGPVIRNGEIDDDEYGFIVSHSLTPQKSRVLLMLALAMEMPVSEIQQFFYSCE